MYHTLIELHIIYQLLYKMQKICLIVCYDSTLYSYHLIIMIDVSDVTMRILNVLILIIFTQIGFYFFLLKSQYVLRSWERIHHSLRGGKVGINRNRFIDKKKPILCWIQIFRLLLFHFVIHHQFVCKNFSSIKCLQSKEKWKIYFESALRK